MRTKPALTWVDDVPEGPLEADEWVRAVREAEFAYAWASNIADFSVPEVTSTWADFYIHAHAAAVQGDLLHGGPRVFAGPLPLAPVSVQVSDDGRTAVVAACVDDVQQVPHHDDGNRWPNVRFYPMELTEDGHRRIGGGSTPALPFFLPDGAELTPEYCDGVTIPRARFDPPPDLEALSNLGRDDVVLPTPTPTATP